MTAINGCQNVWYKKNTHVVDDYSCKPCCSSSYLYLGINFQSVFHISTILFLNLVIVILKRKFLKQETTKINNISLCRHFFF